MLDYFLKYALPGILIVYCWDGISTYLPLLKNDFKQKDYRSLFLDLLLLLLFPISSLSATKRYIELLIKNPDALCPHEYKDIGTTEVDGMTWNRTQCTKCGHIIITIKEKEE